MENLTLDTIAKEIEKINLENKDMASRVESLINDIEEKTNKILPLLQYVKSEMYSEDGFMSEWTVNGSSSRLIIKSHRYDLTQVHRFGIFIDNVEIISRACDKFIPIQQIALDYNRAIGYKKDREEMVKKAEYLDNTLSEALSNQETK